MSASAFCNAEDSAPGPCPFARCISAFLLPEGDCYRQFKDEQKENGTPPSAAKTTQGAQQTSGSARRSSRTAAKSASAERPA